MMDFELMHQKLLRIEESKEERLNFAHYLIRKLMPLAVVRGYATEEGDFITVNEIRVRVNGPVIVEHDTAWEGLRD